MDLEKDKKEYIILPSSGPLLVIGILTAILVPIVGIILGIYFLFRPQLLKEGLIIFGLAFIWTIFIIFFIP